jgi:hypothetical protein
MMVYRLHRVLCKRPQGASSVLNYHSFAECRAGRFPRVLRGRKRGHYRVAYDATQVFADLLA